MRMPSYESFAFLPSCFNFKIIVWPIPHAALIFTIRIFIYVVNSHLLLYAVPFKLEFFQFWNARKLKPLGPL